MLLCYDIIILFPGYMNILLYSITTILYVYIYIYYIILLCYIPGPYNPKEWAPLCAMRGRQTHASKHAPSQSPHMSIITIAYHRKRLNLTASRRFPHWALQMWTLTFPLWAHQTPKGQQQAACWPPTRKARRRPCTTGTAPRRRADPKTRWQLATIFPMPIIFRHARE